ncbi:transferase activity protein [[Candida] boidinii]|nr:transferase activity protein [[Candida] boidinii]OWB84962.1 transferase activity protein [[Candida] boidinii]GMF98289.1 unnamed protein product [[Candida] boidinii]
MLPKMLLRTKYQPTQGNILKHFKSVSLFSTTTSTQSGNFQVFNRDIKLKQRERAALDDESKYVEYIRDEVARRTIERLAFVKKDFPNFLDFGSHSGNFERLLCENKEGEDPKWTEDKNLVKGRIGKICMVDSSKNMLFKNDQLPFNKELDIERVVADEEAYNHAVLTKPENFDCVVSNLSLHWINDLPNTFKNIFNSLKPNGVFMGSMFGGDTLFELRTSLQLAEMERYGGLAPRVSPFVGSSDVGSLMQKAGFQMLTVDVEEIVVGYPSLIALLRDLQLMGEGNSILSTPPAMTKDLLLAAEPIYRAMHGDPNDGSLPATFRFVFMIGWRPGQDFPQPLKRGSGKMSLKDALDKNGHITGTTTLTEDK